jgi:ABC-2 type transport system ATP-binding protein
MSAGAYIGRIGGLAVALGIGAAVATGHGVASADTSDASGAESPSTSSATDSSTSTGSSTKTTNELKPTATKKPEPTTEVDPTPATTKKKSNDSKPSASTADPVTKPMKNPSPASTTAVHSDTTESTKTIDEPAHVTASTERASTVAVTPTPRTEPVEIQQPVAPVATKPENPVEVVTTAISTVISAVLNPSAGNAPTAPVEAPLTWTMLAAARRESFATAPSLNKTASVVTNSLTADAAVPTAAPAVVAIEQTAPLAFLQQIPIIGPMFVTPIVAFIHQIPLIGDILHPYIGYPVAMGLPAGTPPPRDFKIISFDGTPIYVHFFSASGKAGQAAPTILNGPGLSLPGETNPLAEDNPFLPNDVIGMAPLLRAGYNVVTWDPRGEWSSGGQLEIDSPDFEARDMSTIISWLAQRPDVSLDAPGDPKVGMVGASYGGGIQLVTAAIDHRVDAIVPTIAWHSLNTSLYKAEAFKSSWGTLLSAALTLTFARANPRILPAAIWGDLTGMVSQADQDLLDSRGPDELVDDITTPTLLIQGTVDTLFTLAEADENAKVLIANGVPTKVVWFCGGHGACMTSVNDGAVIEQNTLAWLDRYVKGDLSVPTGPQFEWVDQHGQHFSSNTYPVAQGAPIVASSSGGGVLPLLPFIGGSGPQLGAFGLGPITGLLGLPSGAPAINALNLKIPAATTTTYIVGAPQLTLTYSGTGVSRHVYAQLVDDTTGLVLGNLVTPVPVTLDGQTHTLTIPLEEVAHTLSPGETVTLQLVASAFPYETITSLGVLNVASMQLSLPTADAAAISTEAETITAA